jgi:hypothetical protein
MIELPSTENGRAFETVGWIQLPAGRVSDWLVKKWGLVSRNVSISFEELQRLTAHTPILRKRVLLPAGTWTAVLTDGPLGTDLGGIPSLISTELGVVAIRAVSSPNGGGREGGRSFAIYVGGVERHVYALKDGSRWDFHQYGDPLDFEEVEAYRSLRIRDRLTDERLRRYLVAAGVPPVDQIDLEGVIVVEYP